MSYIFLPRPEVFFGLPTSSPGQIFAEGWIARDQGELHTAVAEFRAIAARITRNRKPAFSETLLHDLDTRPVIAVIADGATLHTNILTPEQERLQELDGRKAFELGRQIAEKGWRAVLPGYTGLCEKVIEGVREGGGQYIVAMTRRSLIYDDCGVPILPQDSKHGFFIVTNTLAESKSALFALSDHSVYLPGGEATYDVFSDHFVLEQTSAYRDYRLLNYHRRHPIILNDDGFWDPFIDIIQHMIAEGFADQENAGLIKEAKSVSGAIDFLKSSLYRGRPWPAFTDPSPNLFVPSAAITIAAELSRDSVVRQIIPVVPKALTATLRQARQLRGDQEISDPILRELFSKDVEAVYCGARNGNDPMHLASAKAYGRKKRLEGRALAYGGSEHGIMGAVADSYLETDCPEHPPFIVAVTPIPFLLNLSTAANEGFHKGITVTIAVPGMQERKMFLTALSSSTSLLSGGVGSFDETSEEKRLISLDVIKKTGIDVVDVNGYWSLSLPGLYREPTRRGYTTKTDIDAFKFHTFDHA